MAEEKKRSGFAGLSDVEREMDQGRNERSGNKEPKKEEGQKGSS